MSIFSTKREQYRKGLGIKDEKIVSLDLWEDGAADKLPKITVTGEGLRFVGTDKEFHHLVKKLS